MSDHLPECPATEVSMSGHSTPPPDYELTYTVCICDRLRACEKRVLRDAVNSDVLRAAIRMAYNDGFSAAMSKRVAEKMDLYDRREVYFNQHGTGENP